MQIDKEVLAIVNEEGTDLKEIAKNSINKLDKTLDWAYGYIKSVLYNDWQQNKITDKEMVNKAIEMANIILKDATVAKDAIDAIPV